MDIGEEEDPIFIPDTEVPDTMPEELPDAPAEPTVPDSVPVDLEV